MFHGDEPSEVIKTLLDKDWWGSGESHVSEAGISPRALLKSQVQPPRLI